MTAYRIGHKQLWVDEGVVVGLSHESLGRFLYVITHYEVNQSPFIVVFDAWHVLGTIRDHAALSACSPFATIPLVYVVGRRLYDAAPANRGGRPPAFQAARPPMVATGNAATRWRCSSSRSRRICSCAPLHEPSTARGL